MIGFAFHERGPGFHDMKRYQNIGAPPAYMLDYARPAAISAERHTFTPTWHAERPMVGRNFALDSHFTPQRIDFDAGEYCQLRVILRQYFISPAFRGRYFTLGNDHYAIDEEAVDARKRK